MLPLLLRKNIFPMDEREQRYQKAQARWYATHAERIAMERKCSLR